MRLRWITAAGVALVAIGLGAFFAFRRPHVAPPKAAPVAAVVPAAPSEIVLTGKIQATKTMNVGAPVDGTIEQFLAEIGDDVTEGEVLARIRNPKLETAQEKMQLDAERAQNHVSGLETALINARLEVSRAEADATRSKLELDRAEKEYTKQQMMLREGVTARLVFEKAEQDYKRLKSESDSLADSVTKSMERVAALTKELEAAKKAFEQRQSSLEQSHDEAESGEVYAPADGVVIARRGQPGEPMTRKVTDLFQLAVDLSALEVAVSLGPQDAERVHAGQAAVIEVKDAPGTISGKIREIKAGQAVVDFMSPSPKIRPGMIAQVKIVP